MKKILLYIAALVLLACAAGGCTRTPARYVTALTDADSLAECGRADSARTLLSTIPADSLSRADKALLYLLWVKTSDKAFLTHTSADTIRMALDYFGSHGPKLRRAEARYYEARVLTDLKDYAAALDAFDEALAILGDDTTRAALHLKSLILSQNAQLFTGLHLYSEALPFYSSAIRTSIELGESQNAVLNINLAIFCANQLDSIVLVEKMLDEASPLLSSVSEIDRAEIEISRRNLLRSRQLFSEAANGIDSVIEKIEPTYRNYALMVATRTFQGMDKRDSADNFARLLTNQDNSSNKTTAYATLLRNRLFHTGDDSSLRLFNTFDSLTDININKFSQAPSVIGHEFLKYRMEQKESLRLTAEKQNLTIIVTVVGIITALITIGFLLVIVRKNRRIIAYKRKESEMYKGQLEIQKINLRLQATNAELESKVISTLDIEKEKQELIKQIRHNYKLLCDLQDNIPVSPAILQSETFALISKKLDNNAHIPVNSPIWNDLKILLEKEAPGFLETIERIYEKTNNEMLHIIMLIRVGFRSVDIAKLLSKAPNTISSHKSMICRDIFEGEVSTKDFDSVIRSISAV